MLSYDLYTYKKFNKVKKKIFLYYYASQFILNFQSLNVESYT